MIKQLPSHRDTKMKNKFAWFPVKKLNIVDNKLYWIWWIKYIDWYEYNEDSILFRKWEYKCTNFEVNI